MLTAFFTVHGLALAPDRPRQRAAARRERFVAAIAAPLRDAVAEFDHTQIGEQDRRRRTGQRILSDITLETRLRILRDLAAHLHARRTITGWAEVATADLEAFLARAPAARHQRTYVLRRFFAWAKGRKLILTDPTRGLSLGAQPAFTGTVLDIDAQRALFARWTSNTTPDHERLVGLLALLHAASNAEIRRLRVVDIDTTRRTVALAGRPFPTPLDPPTWTALQRCLTSREAAHTLNPHVIVTRVTSGRDTAADSSYLTRLLARGRHHACGLPPNPADRARQRPRPQAHRGRARHEQQRPGPLRRRQRRPRPTPAPPRQPALTNPGAEGATLHTFARTCASSTSSRPRRTFKGTWGHHSMTAWCDNTGESLAFRLRPGNAGSNTALDHIEVLDEAITQLPARYRRNLLITVDGAGATLDLVRHITKLNTAPGRRVHYSVGFDLDHRGRTAIGQLSESDWDQVLDHRGRPRDPDDAGVTELTGLLRRSADGDRLPNWPTDMRIICRRERPSSGAQLSLMEEADGWRYQLVATNTPTGHAQFLEARHRPHARVEEPDASPRVRPCSRGRFLAFAQLRS